LNDIKCHSIGSTNEKHCYYSWNNKEEWNPPQLHRSLGGMNVCHIIGVIWTSQRCHSSHKDVTLMSHYCNMIVTLVLHRCHSLWLTGIHHKLMEDPKCDQSRLRTPPHSCPPTTNWHEKVRFGLARLPKSQNARLWLLSLKVALLRVSYTDTLDHNHTFPTPHA